jgi:hypothetical protein
VKRFTFKGEKKMSTADNREIADPGISGIFECQIEVSPNNEIGRPITVIGTLKNTGPLDAWVLYRNTFLDPKPSNCVNLSHNGTRVPFVGASVVHGQPSRGSFLRIQAGHSVTGQLDLNQKYDISEPGKYEVSFNLRILGTLADENAEPPFNENLLQLTVVESELATFNVSGVNVPPHIESVLIKRPNISLRTSFPLKPTEPEYVGLTKEQADAMHRAHYTAYNNILLGLENVQTSIDHDKNRLYCENFDQEFIWGRTGPWQQRWETVINTLSSMAELMTGAPIIYKHIDQDPNCSFDRLAYTYMNSRTIFACNGLFNDDLLRFSMWNSAEWGRAFAVVHEISHAAASTTDDWYSWSICQQLATFNPGLAVTNAQNYALYIMLGKGGDLPLTNKYRVKCVMEKDGEFVGWLDSSNNWLSFTGTDPNKVSGSTVYTYEYGGEKFIARVGSSRYIGDNGNQGQGDGPAAWNLWSRATYVEWIEPSGRICIYHNKGQHLCKGDDGGLYWSDKDEHSLTFEFVEV